jgi:hypothetical protein
VPCIDVGRRAEARKRRRRRGARRQRRHASSNQTDQHTPINLRPPERGRSERSWNRCRARKWSRREPRRSNMRRGASADVCRRCAKATLRRTARIRDRLSRQRREHLIGKLRQRQRFGQSGGRPKASILTECGCRESVDIRASSDISCRHGTWSHPRSRGHRRHHPSGWQANSRETRGTMRSPDR